MYSETNNQAAAAAAQPISVLQSGAGQKVLRDTYRLLSATLLFSAVIAGTSAALRLPAPGLLLTLAGYFGLLFLTFRLRNSLWGLASVFALTGFMGYTLGPVIGHYLGMANGPQLVATTMAVTAGAFLGLSWYARSSAAVNMANWGSFLMIGIITAFGLGLAAVFFQMPALALAVSGLFVLLMSGLIMFETQNIVRGGETNYIMATVSLFVSIYNLFASLLHIFGFLGGEDG
ncbi:MAG: Bax inhibitor-1/YccA family protein [Gammaproteobacteria bacterium]|jgi:modulator of FtsH protease|nr:Bax inhibitor-1/YccA family protein [Gammaproteobacteria bacterium]MDH5171351.1 Bax inhibitor-1/YccA family protein [Gammaproteobacteria bacterium]